MRMNANSTAVIAVSRMDIDISDSVLCQNLDHLPGAHTSLCRCGIARFEGHSKGNLSKNTPWSQLGQIFTTRSDNKADLYHTNWTTLQIFTTRFDSRLARIKCLLFL